MSNPAVAFPVRGCSPRRATGLAIALGLVYMTPVFLVGALNTTIRASLGLDREDFGLAVGAFFLAGAVLMPFAGHIVDWIGPRAAYRVSVLMSVAALTTIAALARSAEMLACGLAIGGAASAIGAPASSTLLVRLVPGPRQSMAFGLERAAIPFATLLAGLAVPTLAAVLTWREVCFLVAASMAVVMLAPMPRVAPVAHVRADLPPNLPRRPLLLAAGAFALVSTSATALSTSFVDFGVTRGLSPGMAGTLLALGSGAAIIARLVLGWRPPSSHGMVMVAGMMLAGSLGYFLIAPDIPALLPFGVCVAFAAGWGWTGIMALAVVSAYARAPGAATGVIQGGGALGGILGPILVGALAERLSYQHAWLVAGVIAMAGALLLFVEPATRAGRW